MSHQECIVVAVGNVFDGMQLYGLFFDHDEAQEWASTNVEDDWWLEVLTDHDAPVGAAPLDETYIVSIGNPFDGLKMYGPFFDKKEAETWAGHETDEDWYVIEVIDHENAPF